MSISIKQKIEEITKLQKVETPWKFKCIFGQINIHGDQICVYSNEMNDYVGLSEFKEAVEWLVNELDGTVKWKK